MLERCLSIVVAWLAFFPANSQASILSGDARAVAESPFQQIASFDSVPTGSTGAILVADQNTGQGAALSSGSLAGLLTVATHGCVEPKLLGGHESGASGNAHALYTDTFKIMSSIVPAGTPVTIDFSVTGGVNAQTNDFFAPFSPSQASNGADASFGASIGASVGSTTGHYEYGASGFIAPHSLTTGLFSASPNGFFTLTGLVGQSGLQVTASLSASSTADASPGEQGDDQAQAILVWGAMPETPGVMLVSVNTGLTMPDLSNVTPGFVEMNIPPPLIELPEPGSLLLMSLGGLGFLIKWRNRQRRRLTSNLRQG